MIQIPFLKVGLRVGLALVLVLTGVQAVHAAPLPKPSAQSGGFTLFLPTVSSQPAQPAAPLVTNIAYDIQLSGTMGGSNFTLTGVMVIVPTITNVTTNEVNPVDVCLRAGDPFAGSPPFGSITFGSNNACIGSKSLVDLAFVSVQGNTVTVQPDINLAATNANFFVGQGGLLGYPFTIAEGGMQIQADAQQVSGVIDVLGTNYYGGGRTRYTAVFQGTARH